METEMKPHQLEFISIFAHSKVSAGKTGRGGPKGEASAQNQVKVFIAEY